MEKLLLQNIPLLKICKDKIIVFEEKGSKYIAENVERKNVYKINVDGELIYDKKQVRCDKGLYSINERKLILIELKGAELEKAYIQLYETYKWFIKKVKEVDYQFRIVLSYYRKNIRVDYYDKKFKKELKKEVIIKNKEMREKI